MIRRKKIEKVREYREEYLKLAAPGTPEYDYLIDRMFFYQKDDKRPWKSRLEYSIIPARRWDREHHTKDIVLTDKFE